MRDALRLFSRVALAVATLIIGAAMMSGGPTGASQVVAHAAALVWDRADVEHDAFVPGVVDFKVVECDVEESDLDDQHAPSDPGEHALAAARPHFVFHALFENSRLTANLAFVTSRGRIGAALARGPPVIS